MTYSSKLEIQAILFDMDGVLIDSEPTYLEMGQHLLKREGVEITAEEFSKYVGTGSFHIWTRLIAKYGLYHKTPDAFIADSRQFVYDKLHHDSSFPPLVPGINMVLELCASVKTAVASSTSLPLIKDLLEKADMLNAFDCLTSGHEVANSKPAPDVFLLAAARLGVTPDKCIVIEDSKNGVAAAKAAGMFCIGLQNPHSGQQDLNEADLVCQSHLEIFDWLKKNLIPEQYFN